MSISIFHKILIYFYIFCALSVFCVSCSKSSHYLKPQVYQRLLNICKGENSNNILVYYFDGDCSICLAKAMAVELYGIKNNMRPVLIAKTLNPEALRFNLNKLKVKSCVYIEQKNEFEKDLALLKVFEVASDRVMIDYDDKFK